MDTKSQVDAGQPAEGQSEKLPDIKELLARVEQLESTNNRLLGQTKEFKAKAHNYQSKLEEIEKSTLEKDGDYQKILEAERVKTQKLMDDFKALKSKTLKVNIINKLSKYAQDVVDLDDLVNQPKFAHILQGGIDEEALELSDEAAKSYCTEVLSNKPWLKKNQTPIGAVTKRPGYVEAPAKDLSNMSTSEIEDMLKTKFN